MLENLGDPRPRSVLYPYEPYEWPRGEITRLMPAIAPLEVSLLRVSQERQTRRKFAALSIADLGGLLWLTCRTHSSCKSEFGFDQHFRPHPSAGALHPIHVVCQRFPGQPWELYEPVEHVLVAIPGSEAHAQNARSQAEQFFATDKAVLLGLVAEVGKTAAKYDSEMSLIWRDAGVVTGYLSLMSEALGLNFCPLGATGDPHIAPLAPIGKLCGAGLAVLGARAELKTESV